MSLPGSNTREKSMVAGGATARALYVFNEAMHSTHIHFIWGSDDRSQLDSQLDLDNPFI